MKLPRPTGDFSKTNWGDRVEMREGKQIKIKTTSALVKVVDKLSDAQWAKIIDTAISASKQKESIPAQVEEVLDSSAESDFELADDDDEKGGGAELDEYYNGGSNSGTGNTKEDHMDIDTHLEGSGQ